MNANNRIRAIKIQFPMPFELITSAAKTVADCFKYRNKTGLEEAMEAIRYYRRARKSRDELWRAADARRVAAVMRPYMEALA